MEKELNKMRESKYWEYLSNNTIPVDELLKYVTSVEFEHGEKVVFKQILSILKIDYNIPEEYLSLRIFISGLMIFKAPDILLSSERQAIEENLYNKSIDIYNFIANKSPNYKLLGKKLVTYKLLFDEWKKKDL